MRPYVSRDWKLYWLDIITAGEKIRLYIAGMTNARLAEDQLTFDAVMHCLTIIGEATKQLPPEARALAPQIDWRRIAGMRDIIVGCYFGRSAPNRTFDKPSARREQRETIGCGSSNRWPLQIKSGW